MIAFDFEYFQPTTIEDANNTFLELYASGKKVMYYGGGTEFISRARRHEIHVDAIIDLKGITPCNELSHSKGKVIIGAANTLTDIIQSNLFPLLTKVSRLIATNTERNKITIGGNITSHLIYREAIMPLLLTDSLVVISGKDGIRKAPINKIHAAGVQLQDDEFIVQIIMDDKFATYPHFNLKRTKHSKVNYPIVSLASLEVDHYIRVAISGVCSYPFRIQELENALNDSSVSPHKRIQNALSHIPEEVIDDMQASADYRIFALKTAFVELLTESERMTES